MGQAFIRNARKVHPELPFCNVSRSAPENFSPGKSLHHIPCDLGREDQVEHAARHVISWLEGAPPGRFMLINNSGFGAYGHFPEPNLSRHLQMIDVNVRAVVHLTGLLLPALRARGGSIVTIASTAAFQPTAYASTYGASKAFVLHWSLALREELRGTGVNTLAVCPGPTATNFFNEAGLGGAISPSLTMSPHDVVLQAMRALHRGRGQVVTGWKNRLLTLAAGLVSKPFSARVGAKLLGRYRLAKVARE